MANKLGELAIRRQGRKTGLLIGTINGQPARDHFLARFLEESGFANSVLGYQMRRIAPIAMPDERAASHDESESEPEDDDPAVSETA